MGTAYNFSYSTYSSSGSTPTFGVTAGGLPPGLSLSSNGDLSGTPSQPGLYVGTVTASAGTDIPATQAFSIEVPQAPIITNAPPSANINTAYNFSYGYNGYPIPTFTVTSGSLPPGLVLFPTGALTGTPTQSGTFTFTIDASNGLSPDAIQSFSITVGSSVVPHVGYSNSGNNMTATESTLCAPEVVLGTSFPSK